MDWDNFHVRAKAALPSDHELPPNRYWIGVLRHDKLEQEQLQELDFVWMKGHGKITASKIVPAYNARYPNVRFELRYKDDILGQETKVKDLNDYNDNVIVFRAVTHIARAPLQHVNAQLKAEPRKSKELAKAAAKRNASSTPIRIKTEGIPAEAVPPSDAKAYLSPVSVDKENDIGTRDMSLAERLGRPRRSTSLRGSDPTLSLGRSGQTQKSATDPSSVIADRPLPAPGLASIPPSSSAQSAYISPSPSTAIPGRGDPYNLGYAEVSIAGAPGAYLFHSDVQTRQSRSSYSAPTIPIAQMLPTPVSEPSTKVKTETELEAKAKPEPDILQPMDSQASDAVEPFNPDDVFARDSSPDAKEDVEARPTDVYLQSIIDQTTPEVLEAGVGQALDVLKPLEGVFTRYASSSKDASAWVQSLDKLRKQAQRKRTVIGVVGNTGAGKSSVINAMLDEERLVPTNCMRACTAVVTEMSWNDSKESSSRYRAEIEFITPADWEKDLQALLREFLTDGGTVVREAADQNSEAGVAWAKFHAVYPKKTKDMVKDSSIPALMAELAALGVLGTTTTINKRNPEFFYKQLQQYVDSKEKATGKDKEKKKKTIKPPIEYWPLIKVVRIYVKSPALSTGAVIVDLPGVQDSNAARAAVAQSYLKQCTGLWIVAPITRAVDDKTAQKLMGDSFKRQLKMDGGLASITFICSKTDDISVTEAIDSLNLQEEMSELRKQDKLNKRAIKDLKVNISDLKESRIVYGEAMDSAVKELEVWEALQDSFDEGNIVYAPRQNKKRKRGKSNGKSQKRRQTDDDSDDESVISVSSASETEDESDAGVEAPRKRLTADDIKVKIAELKESRKAARRERITINGQVKEAEEEIAKLENSSDGIRAQKSAICISGRNEYSKGAIQQDFAAGVKELDQEHAAEEDEDNFDPDKELRDYDQVANALPVFCVSSRAYQKMCGRMQKDEDVPGFSTPKETEIPQLQAHCKKLTESGRIQTSRTFLIALQQHLNTFYLWASNDGTGLKLTDLEKRREVDHLESRLRELEKGLEKAVESCINTIKNDIASQIFNQYPKLIEEAIAAAPDTAQRWGAPKPDGGLVWSTYKAVVRRDGVYQSSTAGLRDFNADLTEPITKRLATGWEKTFQHKLPKAFEGYTKTSSMILRTFHEKIEERARHNGMNLANMQLLANNATAHERLFDELRRQLMEVVTELQRDANREFTPTIVAIMHTVYEMCACECGQGSFARMKGHMSNYIDGQRHQMFTAATEVVRDHLRKMCRTIEEQLAAKADDIFLHMKRDYSQALGGIDTSAQDVKMPKFERELRAEIKGLLCGVDGQFKDVAEGKVAQPSGEDEEVITNDDETEEVLDIDADETEMDEDEQDEIDQNSSDVEMKDGDAGSARDQSQEL
ncbi:hypothetical protein BDV96DRAFT_640676 [Lophiotrema nucula]|uniref:Tat pathway signal sequence n=1 Tax=Lophiotrema nucula TaxID=690887 RepID=A0A6A5ZNM5_9PLEO|nr:hypothetical protein BDV96DRAFT_640676 [Lophiotrema nucula]